MTLEAYIIPQTAFDKEKVADTQTNSLPKHTGQTSETLSIIWVLWLTLTYIT